MGDYEVAVAANYEQYKHEWTVRRSRVCTLKRGSYIKPLDGSDCSQSRHFRLRNPYRSNLLLYIIPHELSFTDRSSRGAEWEHIRNRARGALSLEFQKAHPEVLFEERFYFMECLWSEEIYPQQDLENHLDQLIVDHLMLCDWIESENDRLMNKNISAGQDESNKHTSLQLGSPISELDILIPTMRAVILLFWPDPPRSPGITERAALVLTGDNTLMKSGPVTLQGLCEHRIPGYDSNDRIVHVPMPKAVEFLIELDKREVAANSELRARNEHYVSQNGAQCLEEAHERVRLAKEARITDNAEGFVDLERRMQEWRGIWRQEGFNERHAELGAMTMCP